MPVTDNVSWRVASNLLATGICTTAMYSDGSTNVWVYMNGRIALFLYGKFEGYKTPAWPNSHFRMDNITGANFKHGNALQTFLQATRLIS